MSDSSPIFVNDVVNGTVAVRASAPVPGTSEQQEKLPHHVACLAPVEDRVYGNASTTGTGDTSLIAASGDASTRTHVVAVQAKNTGGSAALITLKDGSAGATLGYLFVPAGGSDDAVYPVPLQTSLNTALYFAASAGSSTIYVSAQGYTAP